jgi:hypothetical protein
MGWLVVDTVDTLPRDSGDRAGRDRAETGPRQGWAGLGWAGRDWARLGWAGLDSDSDRTAGIVQPEI